MRILVCVKRVPAPGAKINLTADEQAVDTAFLGFTTSPHEECAVETALQLVETHGGEVTVLTLGPPDGEEQLRYAASLGVSRCVLLRIDELDWDPQRTAAAITHAVRELEAPSGPFDLVLFGNESADTGGFQVGVRVAVALDRPMINGAKGLTIEGDRAVARRESDAGHEIYTLALPAIVGVKEGINLPRYPTMKGRLASKKVALETRTPDAPAGGLRMTRLAPPPVDHREVAVLGQGADAAPAVVDLLDSLGLV